MAFNTEDIQIQDIFTNKVFKIPRNQRKYVWDKANWAELMSDLRFAISADKEHFLGSIVLSVESPLATNIKCFSIIDGQQRIITNTIIICVLAQLFLERGMKDSFNPIRTLLVKSDVIVASKIYPILDVSISETLNNLITLIYNQNIDLPIDKQSLLKKLDYSEPNIVDCFEYYYNAITDFAKDSNEILLKCYEKLLKIRLVSIETSSEEDSYTIFEILNARGVELEDYELLKNFIMRYYTPKDDLDEVKERWQILETKLNSHMKIFVSHYTTHKYGERPDKRDNRPYKIISQNVKSNTDIISNIKELMDDIELKAEYYERIIDPFNKNNSKDERIIFAFLKKRRQQQFRPLILGLMNARDLKKISDEKYLESLRYLFIFFVSYNIIGEENSNKIEDIIYKYAKKFSLECSEVTISEFKKEIEAKLSEKEIFVNSFMNKGYSSGHHQLITGSKNGDRARIVLMLLEIISGGDFDYNFDFTIEHIESDVNEHSYMFGNLLPLSEEDNQKVGNKSIEQKIEVYKKSKYLTTREFADKYSSDWNIETETRMLANKIYNVFLYKKINHNSNN
jgi:uncharacterized protein with ParB-like and HNH nuclease domain